MIMVLILGIIIIVCAFLWFWKEINEMYFPIYDTTFCRRVRAQTNMIDSISDIETLKKILSNNSKF